jgi:hypothetical protein
MAANLARAQKIEDQANAFTKERDGLKAQVRDAEEALARAEAKKTTEVTALSRELERLRALHNDAMAAEKKAAQELASTRAEQQALTADLQRVFLAAAAGKADVGENDLAARKAAVTHYRMASRAAGARRDAATEPQRLLIDKLEATLTRLELLKTDDLPSVKAFQKSLAQADYLKQIDASLAASPAPAARVWLIQTRLILAGADHAE